MSQQKKRRRVSSSNLDKLKGIDWKRVNREKRSCVRCGAPFRTMAQLVIHKPCFYDGDYYRDKDAKSFVCQECGHSCSSMKSLVDHFHGHCEPTFRCRHCRFRTGTKRNLFKHIKRNHYSCTCPVRGCRVRLYSKDERDQHLAAGVEAHTAKPAS